MLTKKLCIGMAMIITHTLSSAQSSTIYNTAIEAAKQVVPNQKLPLVANTLEYIKQLSTQANIEDSFHTINVCNLVDKMLLWQEYLPQVSIHYALKTNHDVVISKVLASLGTGFDCASVGEMRQVLDLGVAPEKIIFSHPRKPIREIVFAEKNHIQWLVLDSIEELDKMLQLAPSGKYLLRIKTHDEHSETPLSVKFGATMEQAYKILDYAYKKKAPIVGISFHVGSNNTDPKAFSQALVDASQLFNYSKNQWQHSLTVLDLGGGWPGNNNERFIEFAKTVNANLNKYFPKDVQVIAEPGRYFATQTTTAMVRIIGTEEIETPEGPKLAYYLSNGVYGLFYASLYYQYDAKKMAMEDWLFKPLVARTTTDNKLYPSVFWGPTCDSGDKIYDAIMFPKMRTNEFIYSANVGSYTTAAQTAFNQITPSKAYYICEVGNNA